MGDAQLAQFFLERLDIAPASTVLVLVEGPADPRRGRSRVELEQALLAGGHTVINWRALGPAKSRVAATTIEASKRMGVEVVLVLSLDEVEGEASIRLRREGGASLELDADRWGELIDVFARPPRLEAELPSIRIERAESRYELAIPPGWRPELGRGPRARPVLFDRITHEWVPYDRAYQILGRDDWQSTFDSRMRARHVMLGLGTVFLAGGVTTSVTFAASPYLVQHGDSIEARPELVAMGVTTALIGSGLLVAGAVLDPHPVSLAELKDELRRSPPERETYGVALRAGPTGASAGFRAAF